MGLSPLVTPTLHDRHCRLQHKAVLLVVFQFATYTKIYKCSGRSGFSMAPTLHTGDGFIIRRWDNWEISFHLQEMWGMRSGDTWVTCWWQRTVIMNYLVVVRADVTCDFPFFLLWRFEMPWRHDNTAHVTLMWHSSKIHVLHKYTSVNYNLS